LVIRWASTKPGAPIRLASPTGPARRSEPIHQRPTMNGPPGIVLAADDEWVDPLGGDDE